MPSPPPPVAKTKAHRLDGDPRPAVEIVREPQHVGRHHAPLAAPVQLFVEIRRVVGAGDDHAPHPLLQRHAKGIVGEIYARGLAEVRFFPGLGAHPRHIDHGICAPKVMPVGVAIRVGEIGDGDVRHRLALDVLRVPIQKEIIVPLAKGGEEQARHRAPRTDHYDSTFGHRYLLVSRQPSAFSRQQKLTVECAV